MNKKIAPIKEQGIKIAIHNAQEIIDLLNIYYTKFNWVKVWDRANT